MKARRPVSVGTAEVADTERDYRPVVVLGLLVGVYIRVLRHADVESAVALRHLRVRHGDLRPGDLVAVAVPRAVRHGARPQLLRPPRQHHHDPVRAVLLARRGTALLVSRRDDRDGRRRDPDLVAGARQDERPWIALVPAGAYLLYPVARVDQLVALPPRCADHHAAAVRVVVGVAQEVGLVRRRDRVPRCWRRKTPRWR